jgi:RNA polymerase sigma factor (sigma-70 family)
LASSANNKGKHLILEQMDNQTVKNKFSNLLKENQGILFKICNAYCAKKSDMEDLAQEMVYQLWKSYGSYIPSYRFTTWMYRIALNTAISFYRKEKRTGFTIPLEEDHIEIQQPNESDNPAGNHITLLRRFINELKELDKALMILYLEERPYREIAEIVGISETNVATKINRIKEKLKQKFTSYNI